MNMSNNFNCDFIETDPKKKYSRRIIYYRIVIINEHKSNILVCYHKLLNNYLNNNRINDLMKQNN